MDRDRVLAMNAGSLEAFFERLQDCNNIDPRDMWNFDEGVHDGEGGKKNELVSRVRVRDALADTARKSGVGDID